MKTLREIDETHSPAVFVEHWKSKIRAVIDISHESPVYDPKDSSWAVSNITSFRPSPKFHLRSMRSGILIKLVDRLWKMKPTVENDAQRRLIGVHCHYGFNRTGFFICCYLIERKAIASKTPLMSFRDSDPRNTSRALY
jgi:hypothetical protein